MVHLLGHDVVLDTLHLLEQSGFFFKRPFNQNVVLAELFGKLEHDGPLLLAGLLDQARELGDRLTRDFDNVHTIY